MTAEASAGVILDAAPLRRQPIRWNLWIGLFIVLATLLLSVFARYLPLPGPDAVDYHARLVPPGLGHIFGTDNLGRDMFSRVVYGAQIDLAVGISTVAASLLIGVLLGLVAATAGGLVEAIIMRIVDALLAFPFIVLVLAIVAVIGPGLTGVLIGMIGVGWTVYARITFSEMRALRERQFMLAAQTLGYRRSRILLRHALPNVLRPNIAFSISDVVLNILGLAGLSYLGAAVKPPTPEWGALISAGQGFLMTGWWISTMPGIAIVFVGIGFSLLGEGVADALGTTTEAVR